MKLFLRLCLSTLIVATSLGTSACGQKGKLVIPTVPAAISAPYPVAQPKPELQDEHQDAPQANPQTNSQTKSDLKPADAH